MKGVFLALTRQILFLLPLILVLPRFWGIDGIIAAGPTADSLAFLCTLAMAWDSGGKSAVCRKCREENDT